MKCPYCSKEIEDEAIICGHCSSAVMEPARLGAAEAKHEHNGIAEASRPSEPEAVVSSLHWTFWLDFVAAGLLGGLALGGLGGFAAGFLPMLGLGGALGGAVGGAVAAGIHWLGLRRYVSLPRRWVVVCCVVAAATWAIVTVWSISTATVSPTAERHWLSYPVIARKMEVWVAVGVLAGAVGGAVSGIMQVRILRQRISGVANWWLLVNTVGWAAGGAVFLPTFWACSMGLAWVIYLLGGGRNPPYTLESAFRNNAAICAPVCGPLLLIVPIWAWIQGIRQRSRS